LLLLCSYGLVSYTVSHNTRLDSPDSPDLHNKCLAA
jgi:hypothetical protein